MEITRLKPWLWSLAVAVLSIPIWVAISEFAVRELTFPVYGYRFWALCWAAASFIALFHALWTRGRWTRSLGLGLMLVPAMTISVGFLNSIPTLQDSGSFIPARSTYRLSTGAARSALVDLGYIGAGALLWFGIRPRDGVAALSASIAALRLPGLASPVGRSLSLGFVWFPILLAATWLTDLVLRGAVPQLVSGDESSVWANMTPYHAVLISMVAAVTEEIQYRVLFMGGLWWLLAKVPGLARRDVLRMVIAVALQAAVFGAAHGGYGTWLHVVQAGLFGLIAGIACVWLGIWAAILLHFLIDIFALGVYAAPEFSWWNAFLWALLAINVATTLAYLAKQAMSWYRPRPE